MHSGGIVCLQQSTQIMKQVFTILFKCKEIPIPGFYFSYLEITYNNSRNKNAKSQLVILLVNITHKHLAYSRPNVCILFTYILGFKVLTIS